MPKSKDDLDTPPAFRARAVGERYGSLHAHLCDKGEASLAHALESHGDEARLARFVFEKLSGDPRRLRRFHHALRRLEAVGDVVDAAPDAGASTTSARQRTPSDPDVEAPSERRQ
jgi:hypothetical protein